MAQRSGLRQRVGGRAGLGLLAYAAWRIYRGIADPLDEGHDKEDTVKRIGFVCSGVANGALAALALRLAFSGGGGSGGSKQSMIAKLLGTSYGPWLVGAAGVVLVGVGLYQFRKGIKADFVDILTRARRISATATKRIGRYGLFARGVVFGIIGYFLVVTATHSNASNFKGTEGTLEYLASNAYGLWLLGATAGGLLLYGVFAVLMGYYGQVADQM